MMKIKVNIKGKMVAVPMEVVTENLAECDGTKLKVLLYVLNTPEFDESVLCDELNITKKSLESALSFWQDREVLSRDEARSPKKTTKAQSEKKIAENVSVKRKTIERAAELPKYTAEEIASIVECGGEKMQELIFNCEQTVGKMFNTAEIEILVGLKDYLKLDDDYIVLLFSHCARMGKKSLRYIEKLSLGLFDDGILAYDELDHHLNAIEAAAGMEKKLRDMFGIGRRALTKKEKEAFTKWSGEWKMPLEVIEKAFEVTVENTGNASVPYCSAVLERWHDAGYLDIASVNAAMEEYKHDRKAAKDKKGSFDTDDFFEAALRRSYGDDAGKLYEEMKGSDT